RSTRRARHRAREARLACARGIATVPCDHVPVVTAFTWLELAVAAHGRLARVDGHAPVADGEAPGGRGGRGVLVLLTVAERALRRVAAPCEDAERDEKRERTPTKPPTHEQVLLALRLGITQRRLDQSGRRACKRS